VDPQRRRALRDFYREEFMRHIDHLSSDGLLGDCKNCDFDAAYRRFFEGLDRFCVRTDFTFLAEILLERFDSLTRLSKIQPRQGH
jgi:hypothetical protein